MGIQSSLRRVGGQYLERVKTSSAPVQGKSGEQWNVTTLAFPAFAHFSDPYWSLFFIRFEKCRFQSISGQCEIFKLLLFILSPYALAQFRLCIPHRARLNINMAVQVFMYIITPPHKAKHLYLIVSLVLVPPVISAETGSTSPPTPTPIGSSRLSSVAKKRLLCSPASIPRSASCMAI